MKTICFCALCASVSVLLLLACATLRAAVPLVTPIAPPAHSSSTAPLTVPPKAAPVVRPATANGAARLPQQAPQRQVPNRARVIRPAASSAAISQTPANCQLSTRLAAPPSLRQDVAPSIASPQLAPAIVESLNTHGIWVDPSLRGLADASAMEQTARRADFPIRVLVVRRVPGGFASVQSLAQVVHQQLQLQDGLVIVATSDDARLGLFGAGLDAGTLNQIVEEGAQTWTQEGYAGGVAQTLRLVNAERRARRQALITRVAFVGGTVLFLVASAIGLRLHRKRKRRARHVPLALPSEVAAHYEKNAEKEQSDASTEHA